MEAQIRQLHIKSGSVKRLAKEKQHYDEELIDLEGKTGKINEDKDEYMIKHHLELIKEAASVATDTKIRLIKAFSDLSAVIADSEEVPRDEPVLISAMQILKDVQPLVETK